MKILTPFHLPANARPFTYRTPTTLLFIPSLMALLAPFSSSFSSSSSSSSSFCSPPAPAARLQRPSLAALLARGNRCPIPFNYLHTPSCSALRAIRSPAEGFSSVTPLKMSTESVTHCSPCSTLSSTSQGAVVADCEGSMQEVIRKNPVVSVHWLHQHLHHPSLKVLDASWYMPAEKRNPFQEFKELHIPGSSFFDIEAISDVTSDLPHMLPSEAAFSAAVSALGIKNEDAIVVYDGSGIFSSARVWWMFRVFGHKTVSVLDGGLPHWRQFGFPVDSTKSLVQLEKMEASALAVKKFYEGQEVPVGDFKAALQRDLIWTSKEVMKNLEDKKFQHIDARSKARLYADSWKVS